MKEKFIRRVKKALPPKLRKEVLRDLEEIFQSAAEHGETEEEVIGRLGCPCDFAKEAALQLGVDLEKRRAKRCAILAGISSAVAVISLIIYFIVRKTIQEVASIGIIGGADGPTSIIISGPHIDVAGISLTVAVIAAVITAILLAKRHRRTKK